MLLYIVVKWSVISFKLSLILFAEITLGWNNSSKSSSMYEIAVKTLGLVVFHLEKLLNHIQKSLAAVVAITHWNWVSYYTQQMLCYMHTSLNYCSKPSECDFSIKFFDLWIMTTHNNVQYNVITFQIRLHKEIQVIDRMDEICIFKLLPPTH